MTATALTTPGFIPSHADTATRCAHSRLRLTMRGRRLLAAVLLVPVGLGIGAGIAQIPAAIAGGAAPAGATYEQFETYTVLGGENLWSIAERIGGDRDPRDVIAEIKRLNNLPTAAVQAGQVIALPNLD